MRCREGDLAVVIRAENKCNLGLIVRVVRLHDGTGDLAYHIDAPVWFTECSIPMTWTKGKKRFRQKSGPVPDDQLQPIRGTPDGCPPFGHARRLDAEPATEAMNAR
jgi:hypothetical protein